jgi:hypothetical protein
MKLIAFALSLSLSQAVLCQQQKKLNIVIVLTKHNLSRLRLNENIQEHETGNLPNLEVFFRGLKQVNGSPIAGKAIQNHHSCRTQPNYQIK